MPRCSRPVSSRRLRAGIVIIVAALLGSCSVMSPDRPQEEMELTRLRIAVTKAIDTVPLRMAVEQHLFEQAGLRVDLVEHATQASALSALDSGEVHLAFAGNITLLKAAAGGADLKLQGEAYISGPNTMALMTLPGGGYDDPTEKPSPMIAIEQRGDLGELTTRSRLATEGVDPRRIQFTVLGFKDMMEALRDSRIDSAWMMEPDISRAQKEYGAKIVTDTARGAMLDFPMSSYAAKEDVAAKYPRTFESFRKLLSQAQQLAADSSVVREALTRFTSLDKTTAALVALGTFPTSMSSVRLQRVADLMHNSKIVDGRIDASELVPRSRQPSS